MSEDQLSMDSWLMSNAALQKGSDRLRAKAMLLLPTDIGGVKATKFGFMEITTEIRKNTLGKLFGWTANKEGAPIYYHYWREGYLNFILARISPLKRDSDARRQLLKAFENGPPKTYAFAYYGDWIAASLLFFDKDLIEAHEDPETSWRSKFIGTFLQWQHEKSPARFSFYDSGFPSRIYALAFRKNPLPWSTGLVFQNSVTHSIERTTLFVDKVGSYFLDLVENNLCTTKIDDIINSLRGENNRVEQSLKDGNTQTMLKGKSDYFSSMEMGWIKRQ